MRILMKKFKKSFDSAEPKPSTVTLDVGNTDRAFGTIIGSEITARFGNALPDDTFHVVCHGYGGQSFGAFIPKGLTLELVGDANDYIGKGLSGGSSSSTRRRTPPLTAARTSSRQRRHCTVLRAAQRSSTAWPVSASACATPAQLPLWRRGRPWLRVHDRRHGGRAWQDRQELCRRHERRHRLRAGRGLDFYQRVNKDMVSLEPVEHKYDVSLLKDLIREHVELTGSPRGREILDNFGEYLPKFKKVLPHDYDKMLRLIAQMEEKGEDSEQAQIERSTP